MKLKFFILTFSIYLLKISHANQTTLKVENVIRDAENFLSETTETFNDFLEQQDEFDLNELVELSENQDLFLAVYEFSLSKQIY